MYSGKRLIEMRQQGNTLQFSRGHVLRNTQTSGGKALYLGVTGNRHCIVKYTDGGSRHCMRGRWCLSTDGLFVSDIWSVILRSPCPPASNMAADIRYITLTQAHLVRTPRMLLDNRWEVAAIFYLQAEAGVTGVKCVWGWGGVNLQQTPD